ncbi:tRNA uridine 5-carboxymethylaminomethyl modification enzyme MnmG [Dissostichus eleginoides]|uniref:tRNA uridine 5-carboxymethylaminomethyl modification enzyme MnmG n=1 Tax=Dissostichus eleginoides TaxID=100907 RepID=A0AAD9BQS2_DISEL|nr:tRNA uridine 5-carboxymethylaminomethyl modification enzyme MnmG [Dissostichus eleginoides]
MQNSSRDRELEVPRSKSGAPPKVAENDKAWDVHIQTDRLQMANQPHIVVVDKQKKKSVVIDNPIDSNTRKKQHEKLGKYQGLREELEQM